MESFEIIEDQRNKGKETTLFSNSQLRMERGTQGQQTKDWQEDSDNQRGNKGVESVYELD